MYSTVLENIARAIRQVNKETSIQGRKEEVNVLLFEDDINLFIKDRKTP